jgi:hypothetical protein
MEFTMQQDSHVHTYWSHWCDIPTYDLAVAFATYEPEQEDFEY